MTLIRPARPIQDETVTISVSDLYDYLYRHGVMPMPDLNQATTVKKAKRGYRKISMTLRVQEYEIIARMAEDESRTPDQQASHMMRRMLSELQVEAIRHAYRDAEAARAARLNGPPQQAQQGPGLVDELDEQGIPSDLPEEAEDAEAETVPEVGER